MAALPPHMPVPSHARHGSTSSVSSISQFQAPPPTASAVNSVNSTRILLLSQFSPALKTKDLIDLVQDYVDPSPVSSTSAAPFKLKWRDDTSCFVVFNDPLTAKRAFLRLISNPPAPFSPRETGTYAPCIHAYTGDDAPQIIQAVQNKQRTRSIAGQGATSGSAVAMGHHRRSSQAGGSQGGGPAGGGSSALPPIATGSAGSPSSPSATAAALSSGGGGHHRTGSWARRTQTTTAGTNATSPSSPSSRLAGAGQDRASPASGGTRTGTGTGTDALNGWRTSSPDQPGGASGIVAGEAPRRFGGTGSASAL